MVQRLQGKYLAAILFAISFVLFIRTVQFNPVWDDERVHFNALNQAHMNKNIGEFWKIHEGMYIPVTYTTWALVKKIAVTKNNWLPLHVLNVLTHSINGVLLFYLFLLLFKNKPIAFWGSLVFLIHPLQVEAVAWISEFRGLYSHFFCLLSLLFFFNTLKKKSSLTFHSLLLSSGYWLALLFFILALLAKPTALVLPLLLLILSWRFYKEYWMLVSKAILIWIIPIAIDLFLLLRTQPESSSTIWQRLLVADYSLLFYLKKIVVPYPLVACYGYTPDWIIKNGSSYIVLFLSILFFAFLFLKRNTFPNAYTGCMVFIICLSPVLGFIPFDFQKYSTVADRYLYFAMSGVVFFIPAIQKLIGSNLFRKSLAGSILIAFFMLSFKQTSYWKDEFSLWDHTLKFYTNSAHVYYNRGVQYSLKGNYNNATVDYSSALSLDHSYLNALFNRANAYENLHDTAAAFKDYATYIQLDAKDGAVYYKRAHLFYKTGQLDKAFDDLQKAEELKFSVEKAFKQLLLDSKFRDK